MRVNEIFFSLQGETSLAGLPCVFIRLTGCNLRCRYCDTRYAYHQGEQIEPDRLLTLIEAWPTDRVVITGGEPLLQPEVYQFMRILIGAGKQVILETNGSRPVGLVPEAVIRIIDLKVPSSGQTAAMYWPNLDQLRPSDQLKFVLSTRADFAWCQRLIEAHRLQGRVSELLFSPVRARLTPKKLAAWLLASGLNARLQIQLHKVIWGASTRGV